MWWIANVAFFFLMWNIVETHNCSKIQSHCLGKQKHYSSSIRWVELVPTTLQSPLEQTTLKSTLFLSRSLIWAFLIGLKWLLEHTIWLERWWQAHGRKQWLYRVLFFSWQLKSWTREPGCPWSWLELVHPAILNTLERRLLSAFGLWLVWWINSRFLIGYQLSLWAESDDVTCWWLCGDSTSLWCHTNVNAGLIQCHVSDWSIQSTEVSFVCVRV